MERISAFMDGEVEGGEAQGQIRRLKEDATLRESWDTYHLIGDTLRGENLVLSRSFTETFGARLASEPTVLAPRGRPLQASVRRFALPVAASVGGMALVVWLAVFNNPFAPQQGQNMAKGTVVTPVPAGTQVAGDQRFNEYLWAHQQVSTGTPAQSVPAYVQTVSGQEAEEKR